MYNTKLKYKYKYNDKSSLPLSAWSVLTIRSLCLRDQRVTVTVNTGWYNVVSSCLRAHGVFYKVIELPVTTVSGANERMSIANE